MTVLGLGIGTFPQWGMFISLLAVIVGGVTAWIKHKPDQTRADTEGVVAQAGIEAALRGDAATQFAAFRREVHGYKNEVMGLRGELQKSQSQSARRGDKINMLRFILSLLLDEMAVLAPENKVLAQARLLLSRIEEEPHQLDNSAVLDKAEQVVEVAQEAVRTVKAEEAKK